MINFGGYFSTITRIISCKYMLIITFKVQYFGIRVYIFYFCINLDTVKGEWKTA